MVLRVAAAAEEEKVSYTDHRKNREEMKTKAMTSSSSSRADSGTRASRRGSLQPPGHAQVMQPVSAAEQRCCLVSQGLVETQHWPDVGGNDGCALKKLTAFLADQLAMQHYLV